MLKSSECIHCGYVKDSEKRHPVQALLGPKPCPGREWMGHEWKKEK